MKKIILIAVTMFMLSNAYSQIEKGSKWITGAARLSISNTDNNPFYSYSQNNSSSLVLDLGISYFKTEKTILYYSLGYNYNSDKYTYNDTTYNKRYNHNFSIGLGKRNIYPLFGKVYGTLGGGFDIGYGFGNQNATQSPFEIKSSTWRLYSNLGIGLMFKATDRFIVTTTLNSLLYGNIAYTIQKSNQTGSNELTSKTTSFNIGTGLSSFSLSSLQFGLMYKLKK